MCYHPRKIVNRSNHFNPSTDPLFITVPCGKCDACTSSQRNDWFVRCYFEYLNCKKQGFNTYFYTLTYSPEHLPRYNSINVFRRRDIQLFIKRLRKELACPLKYIITSEFGELYGRSHYHCLFFVYDRITPHRLNDAIYNTWRKGFVKPGKNRGIVNGIAGIKYVTKYITKDITYHHDTLQSVVKFRFCRLYRYLVSRYLWHNGEHKDYLLERFSEKYRSTVRSLSPFHLQSTNLGSRLFDYFDVQSLETCKISILESKGVRYYKMPRYYARKLWYDVLPSERTGDMNRFVINESGIKHKFDMLETEISERVSRYQSLIRCTRPHEDMRRYVNLFTRNVDDYTLHQSIIFDKPSEISFFLKNIDLDLKTLAIYAIYLRGRINFFHKKLELTEDYINRHYSSIIYKSLTYYKDADLGRLYARRDDVKRLSYELFDTHPFFQSYDMVLTLFDAIESYNQQSASTASREHDLLVRKTREVLLKFNYG